MSDEEHHESQTLWERCNRAEADLNAARGEIERLNDLYAQRERLWKALRLATEALKEVARDHARDRASYRSLARDALISIKAATGTPTPGEGPR